MSTSISIKELKELDPSSYQIVDIRDAVEISHGAIPGALVMKTEEIERSADTTRSYLDRPEQKDDYLLQPRPVQCRSGGRITGKRLGRCEPGGRLHRLADGCDERAGGAGQGGRRGEESPQKIQKVDLVQIYESDQHIRAGKTGR